MNNLSSTFLIRFTPHCTTKEKFDLNQWMIVFTEKNITHIVTLSFFERTVSKINIFNVLLQANVNFHFQLIIKVIDYNRIIL